MRKGVIFDLDGTLVTSPLCFKTIRRELEIPADQYILEYLATLPESMALERMRRLAAIELAAAQNAS